MENWLEKSVLYITLFTHWLQISVSYYWQVQSGLMYWSCFSSLIVGSHINRQEGSNRLSGDRTLPSSCLSAVFSNPAPDQQPQHFLSSLLVTTSLPLNIPFLLIQILHSLGKNSSIIQLFTDLTWSWQHCFEREDTQSH